MRCTAALCRRATLAAAVPPNYSNTPYKKDSEAEGKRSNANKNRGNTSSTATPFALVAPKLSSTPGTTFIDPNSTTVATSFNNNDQIKSFRQRVCAATDVSMRPLLLLLLDTQAGKAVDDGEAAAPRTPVGARGAMYGEVLQHLSCRWAAKFYGKVTFAPRNYPYPSSRWLARRFQMKKHRILKRFRFRRYKLAAVANLPFAKMIRVGMLPELKSSKTKKGDAVDGGLSSQLVSVARSSSSGGKSKGKRTRPKSKYQV
ncbi:putative mitochondrial hypothetical protein [Leptomonas pyrrhocoris]|uniref:Uncharacterized protein n=1 Tax=Leptomonas pyrrhocoris TaxID=157538 RepID=A0A0M9GBB2_LEPPY|nr:putative mitochondrial hypothetical protein [Leptomonas pyrrhocoris]KPA86890.1 putative mitochondrial hypothetical protein [Leptomonas pyrrhocoris]|eukprot:XP_015665329.1 putative mitochondrial hypothetical protein [Leptomonas pyrrhocoris]